MGIPVINYTPSKGQDKHARVNAVAPLFEWEIWAPDEKFAEEVIEECASFPMEIMTIWWTAQHKQ